MDEEMLKTNLKDFKLILLGLVNKGVYTTINEIFFKKENWKFYKFRLLFIIITLFPFTIFHLYKFFANKLVTIFIEM